MIMIITIITKSLMHTNNNFHFHFDYSNYNFSIILLTPPSYLSPTPTVCPLMSYFFKF
jgi:hypothetical protein